MRHRVFIDGQAGTTGLEIHARLAHRPEIELLEIDPSRRKDPAARRELLNDADAVILCLPDDAAREAVALIESPGVRVLDASTAHRIADDWVFGLPELAAPQRDAIRASRRIANPGCYSTGFILAVRPLRDAGLLRDDGDPTVHALSGYSGGGRAMVDRYRALAEQGPEAMLAPRAYGLGLDHKHLPEMAHYTGLARAPVFTPMVGHFYKGMLVQIPLPASLFARPTSPEELVELFARRYEDDPCIRVLRPDGRAALEEGFLDPQACNDSNRVDLMVFGNAERMLVIARLDNLGKGAGGAAVQNLNLVLGLDELAGVSL
ncbi:MAG TPA: N-acetyl-gamma-glutamyl-phosphate reductase [Pseudomonadales bacterium]|nr:N-acetyl-gamma-glutamyl-phosphate reductase [Pseudomonadales bacterium]